jgi:fatty acid desaturase
MKKIIAPIVVTIIVLAFMLFYALMIVGTSQQVSGLGSNIFLIMVIILLIIAMLTMIYVLIQRIKEIKEEDNDDLSQY